MKTLYILRHAKSSWDNSDLDDFHRPLNDRGEKDAPRMGRRLRKGGHQIDLICSSPAVRALSTAQKVAHEIEYPLENIRTEKSIYHGEPETILSVVQSFGDKIDKAMIVGHNPGLTEFVNDMFGEEIGNIPTAGVACGVLNINSWKDATWGCGKLETYDYPKREK